MSLISRLFKNRRYLDGPNIDGTRSETIAQSPLAGLIAEVNDALSMEPVHFYTTMDRAKSRFRNAVGDDLQLLLLGLKISNLLISKYEYERGAIVTTAHPVSFMLDTANQCQLGCPSCTNSFNREHADATFNAWPRGILKEDRFRSLIDSIGITAFAGHFYNNHEPFLNKNTPAYLRVASDMQIETFVSSNLSFPKMDHEAIVRSGLKELLVALDGVTQESYQKYRKGGRLDWAFANVRAIADAKKRLGLTTPYIRWQWLTFEHNVHEVEKGIEVARDVGFDCFNLATPNRVDQDDPTVHSVQYEGPVEHRSVVINPRPQGNFASDLEPYRAMIDNRLSESALGRWEEAGGPASVQPEDRTGDRCDWLHMAVISDAMGRIVPCCRGDYKNAGKFVFSTVDADHQNLMNTSLYQESRILMADPVAYKRATVEQKPEDRTRCLSCPVRPAPQIGLGAVHSWLVWSNKPQIAEIEPQAVASLHNWSRHRTIRSNYQTSRLNFIGPADGSRFHNASSNHIAGIGQVVVAESDIDRSAIDIHVNAVGPLTAELQSQGRFIGKAESSFGGWQHFALSTMTTPGIYELALSTTGEMKQPVEIATINVAEGGTMLVRGYLDRVDKVDSQIA